MVTTRSIVRAAAVAASADTGSSRPPPNLANGPPHLRYEHIRDLADMSFGSSDQETSAIRAEASRIREGLVGAQCDELVPTGPNNYRPCRAGPQFRRRVDFCDQKSPPPEGHDFQGHKVYYDCRTRIVHEHLHWRFTSLVDLNSRL